MPLDAFDPPYMQRAALAVLLLAVPLGLLGVWVVLRGMAFFAHAVGVATFPGVVVGLGVPAIGPFAGALGAGLAFAAGVTLLERDDRLRGGAVTGLMLAAALALGAVLLTAAFAVVAPVESMLFGSLLAISTADVVRCAVVGAVAVLAVLAAAPRLAAGTFDRGWAEAAGGRPARVDALLLALVAAVVIAALPAAGNLLASGLMVLPAAAARLVTDRLGPLLALSVALCAAEGLGGLVLAQELDAPPGAAIAVLGGVAFAAAAAVSAVRR